LLPLTTSADTEFSANINGAGDLILADAEYFDSNLSRFYSVLLADLEETNIQIALPVAFFHVLVRKD
jgi:hypothetical protein